MTDKEKEELKFKAICIDASSDFLADYDELLWWVEAKKKEWELLAKIEMNQAIADYVSDYAITPTYDRIKEMLEYKMRFLIIRNMKWPH